MHRPANWPGADIFTEADDLAQRHGQLRDAVARHFEASERPRLFWLRHNRSP